VKYLADAHALEVQAVELLEKAKKMGGDPRLTRAYADHLVQTYEHRDRIAELLHERDASPSTMKDAAMKMGAVNWGAFFQAHPDTPGKLAAFAFAFEHLEIAAYEQLRYVANAASDLDAGVVARGILRQEREAAQMVAEGFDLAVQASLDAVGVT
jgi:ferritin-like metal-binding protein YciE